MKATQLIQRLQTVVNDNGDFVVEVETAGNEDWMEIDRVSVDFGRIVIHALDLRVDD